MDRRSVEVQQALDGDFTASDGWQTVTTAINVSTVVNRYIDTRLATRHCKTTLLTFHWSLSHKTVFYFRAYV